MRLASFAHNGTDLIGFEIDGRLYDLNSALKAAGQDLSYPTMIALIEDGDRGREAAQAALRHVEVDPGSVAGIPAAEVRWHPPVRKPYKICGIAMNNSASDARKISAPDHPLFFLKPASSLVGHNEPIIVKDHFGSVHPEPELAVIIAKDCKDVAVEDAMDYVFGYSILNDMTGNGMRAEDMVHYYALYPSKENPDVVEKREQHLSYTARYKGTDTFGPMGPYLVTKDDVPDPHVLDVRAWHKDEIIAEDSTAYYTYSVPEIIAFVTRYHTLWAGDVISMGTAFRPSAGGKRSLHLANITKLGGPVSVEISGLGRLENPVEKR
ncbi:fumarylacetoacetate hydrolase family protein [Aquamicrobium zhengzhouense]|uniref:Fumarylacetoacetate hydrolase family protein n=1 Tax=Aquamicrobium zhengzhouense TaxID=2781738 RepID=A0ABS0SHT2_9HYPH|nr:fumarylacetoacetate hydrolase family protein [Aquamicrobium zhengzhouense]MBI1622836.1 fumarylacetoacetate hydrolase family protein [Aquamicrobium zhengzhouense]